MLPVEHHDVDAGLQTGEQVPCHFPVTQVGAEQDAPLSAGNHLMKVLFPVELEGEPVGNARHDHYLVYQRLPEHVIVAVNVDQRAETAVAGLLMKILVNGSGGTIGEKAVIHCNKSQEKISRLHS